MKSFVISTSPLLEKFSRHTFIYHFIEKDNLYFHGVNSNAPFLVYNASAGSGKTYTLVSRYLKLCLKSENPRAFREILAITFTNKAANEMKERILEELRNFAAHPKADSLLGNLASELEISLEKMKKRASDLLTAILHNYSAFSVSTIDKFTNRIIRSFARDLNLAAHYEVEMDGTEMLREAIDEMLSELSEKSAATGVLLDFVSRSLEENRSPRPEKSLQEVGANLFNERAFASIRKLKEIGLDGVENARKELYKEKEKIEGFLKKTSKETLEIIENAGLSDADFSGRYSIFTYLNQYANGDFHKWMEATAFPKFLTGGILYRKTEKADVVQKFESVNEVLFEKVASIENVELFVRHHLLTKILRKIHSLAALTEIDRHLQILKERSNRLPIGEFNRLIGERLEAEPARFIFEKLGERYTHFFVDEFQDTSILQWQNLTPLINNSISSGGSAMIVGDGKQSIYRWRGGEVEQFLELSKNEHPSNQIALNGQSVSLYERQTEILENNWRSRQNIVQFNNQFFTEISQNLIDENHKDLYQKTTEQKARKEEGGLVEISLLPYENDAAEHNRLQCEKCSEIVRHSRENGYSYGDITFLTRNNRDGALLSEYFLKEEIPVVTPDSLSLGSSAEVNALVSWLAMQASPDDLENRYPFFEKLWELTEIQTNYSERHLFFKENIKQSDTKLLHFLKEKVSGFSFVDFTLQALSDQCYEIARALQMNPQSNPFLHNFLDTVQKFEIRHSSSAAAFLRWWEEKGKDEKIKLGGTENAVQVMSIHKSKGLQFPITVVPFANWRVTQEPRPEAWLDLETSDFQGLPTALVGLSKPNENAADENYAAAFAEYERNVRLDNLNLLYVAFTRTEQELYVISTKGHREDGKRVQAYLSEFLESRGAEDLLRIGEATKATEDSKSKMQNVNFLETYASKGWRHRLEISLTAPNNWNENVESPRDFGLKVHSLMAEIKTEAEIETALGKMVWRGDFSSRESETLKEMALKIVRHPKLSELFYENTRVLNESEILIPDQKSARPDRVVIFKNETHILDYKTGIPNEKDERQIIKYRTLLTEMGLTEGKNFLIYLGESLEVKSV